MFGLGSYPLYTIIETKEKETNMIKFKKLSKPEVVATYTLRIREHKEGVAMGKELELCGDNLYIYNTTKNNCRNNHVRLTLDEVQQLVDFLNEYGNKE